MHAGNSRARHPHKARLEEGEDGGDRKVAQEASLTGGPPGPTTGLEGGLSVSVSMLRCLTSIGGRATWLWFSLAKCWEETIGRGVNGGKQSGKRAQGRQGMDVWMVREVLVVVLR